MPYSTSNPPNVLTFPLAGFGATNKVPALWFYTSTDAATAVRVAGYITNGRDLGMKVGDVVVSLKSDASPLSIQLHIVSAINATTGAADLSDGTAITATNTD